MHQQSELRVFRRFAGNKLQKANLRNHQDVWETRFKSAEVERAERPSSKLQRWACYFGVGNLVEFGGQPHLLEEFQGRRMNCIAGNSRSKSLCISRRVTGIPRRAKRRASTAPAGPAPTMQHEVVCVSLASRT